ncbi:MAG: tetratricopeptide repeat protein [Phycisphaerales bacterium]|nr:tetratricopeptide repeat protein [Phycisphaerales bacterium]
MDPNATRDAGASPPSDVPPPRSATPHGVPALGEGPLPRTATPLGAPARDDAALTRTTTPQSTPHAAMPRSAASDFAAAPDGSGLILGLLGAYELLGQVAQGGQGVVYRARQPGTGREVALKRLAAGAFSTPQMLARFEREVEACGALDHPNIVNVLGFELIDGQPVLAMRWIDGVPFDRWACPPDGPRRGTAEILAAFLRVCDAIQHDEPRWPPGLESRVGRELEAIVRMALAKDAAQRYQSVADLSADVRRFLAGEAILAHPPSVTYRLRKFVRRHRQLVGAGAALALTLAATTVVVLVLYVRAERSAVLARDEAAQASAMADFLRELLTDANPRRAQADEVKLRDLLEQASKRLADARLRPNISGDLRETLGNAFNALGLHEPAQREFAAALDAARTSGGPPARIVERLGMLGGTRARAGAFAEALGWLEEAQATADREIGPDSINSIELRAARAAVLRDLGNFDQSERLLREALALAERRRGNTDPLVGQILQHLCLTLNVQGKHAEALEAQRRVVGIVEQTSADDRVRVLSARHNLASQLAAVQRHAEAQAIWNDVLPEYARVLGAEHPDRASVLSTLAASYAGEGRNAEAAAPLDEAIRIARVSLGDEHPFLALYLNNRGQIASQLGDFDGAVRYFDESLAIRRNTLPGDHPYLADSLSDAAWALLDVKRETEAEPLFAESARIWRDRGESGRMALSGALAGQGEALLALQRADEAIPVLEESLRLRTELAPNTWRRYSSQRLLGSAHLARGDVERAGPLLREAAERLFADPQAPGSVKSGAAATMRRYLETIGEAAELEAWRARGA